MERRPLVVAWGELLFDIFPDGPRLGGPRRMSHFTPRRSGARTLLASRVGDDALGRSATAELSASGVDVRFVSVDAERPTGTVRVELVGGEPRFTIGEQAAWDRIELAPELEAELATADAFVFGTLAQRTALGSEALARALARLPPGCHRIADLNVRPPHVTERALGFALGHASVVKLNELEAARVSALLGGDAVTQLLARGVSLVALTRGGSGALLATQHERQEQPAIVAAAGGDPVGAGDAFTAALALALCRQSPLATCLARANRYASFVAGERGAMPRPPLALLRELGELG